MGWKGLERSWKRRFYSGLRLYLGARRVPLLPDWTSGERRVLVLRPDGIGDAIVTTPLLRAIAGISPEMTVDVVASTANAPFLTRLDFVRRVFVLDRRRKGETARLARALRAERYDAVLDPRIIEPSMTGLMMMLATGASSRIGVGGRGADGALTHVVPLVPGHIIGQLAGFGSLFGLHPSELLRPPYVPLEDPERNWAEQIWSGEGSGAGRRLLVNVSAGERPRVWPEQRFARVIQAVRSSDGTAPTVVVIGAPAEWEKVQHLAAATGSVPVSTPSLAHLAGIVATAELVLTADTSVVHIASAFARPVVAMYLPGTAERWGAFRVSGANLESPGATLLDLEEAPVTEALLEVLSDRPPPPWQGPVC